MGGGYLHTLFTYLEPVFAASHFIVPLLLIGMGVWLRSCLVRMAEMEAEAAVASEPLNRPDTLGLDEDPTPFEPPEPPPPPEPKSKRWLGKRRVADITGILSLVTAAILLAGEIKNLLPEPEPGRKGAPKQFEKYLERAETSLADGDKDGAKADFMNALKVKKAEVSDAAEAMHGLARLLKEEGRFDAAEPLAHIAARLHADEPDYVHTYAEILIAQCRLPDALDALESLELYRDNESERLIDTARSKTDACRHSPSES